MRVFRARGGGVLGVVDGRSGVEGRGVKVEGGEGGVTGRGV